MNTTAPHYLLFSETTAPMSTRLPASTTLGGGRWRIIVEAADGSSRLEAADDEALPAERLELLAVIRGLEAIPQPARVTLRTDSEYVRRGLRFGLPQWRKNGWQWERFGLLSPISHADLWQRLDRALQIHRVECRAWRLDAGPAAVGAEPAPSPPPCRKRPAWRAFGERWQRWLTTLRSVGRSRPRAARWCAS